MKTKLPPATLTNNQPLSDGTIAELVTLRLHNGSTVRWTTADLNLTHDHKSYPANTYNSERSSVSTRVGIEVDEVTLSLYPNAAQRLNGLLLPEFTNQGGFDNAWLTLIRSHADYAVHLFAGLITDAKADRTVIELTASTATVLLNIDMPRNVYTAGCLHSLFDQGCGLSKSTHKTSTSVASGSTQRLINTALTDDDNHYELGTLSFTSGLNAGLTRTIKAHTLAQGQLTLSMPLPNVPALGDSFDLYPGCNKLFTTCVQKFNNSAQYRGFPYMPVPEASV
jgi:uncharacterized phage protein (TIGR02218 family)